ncbi:hypothetical protein Mlaev_01370 [Microbacterium laevaniformans]|uniref:O-antigen ligase domain-containing protein n=1 Tax=Microbacterium laevaniformans TaxID=36807 RepID=A0A150HF57_9MICO|nr:hypothetical protein Mlaev_01370 [Microbacterium laevaniformans]
MLIVCILLEDGLTSRLSPASTVVILCYYFSSLWLIWKSSVQAGSVAGTVTGTLIGLVLLPAFASYFSRIERARAFAQVYCAVTAVLSASSAITMLLAIGGFTIKLLTFPIGTWSASLLFPFTTTVSQVSFFGFYFDRFTGIGREPGWMGMHSALAWTLWPHAFRGSLVSRVGRFACIAGVLTSGSTAGFGVFVVAVAMSLLISRRRSEGALRGYSRIVFGGAALGIAAWLAVFAPQYGLQAKQSVNSDSLEGRALATDAGLRALTEFSLGEQSFILTPNVNLIAGASVTGWPFFVLSVLGLLLPLAFVSHKGAALPPLVVIFLTMLLAQPIGGSHGVYILVMLVCAVADGDATRGVLWRGSHPTWAESSLANHRL